MHKNTAKRIVYWHCKAKAKDMNLHSFKSLSDFMRLEVNHFVMGIMREIGQLNRVAEGL